MVPACEFDRLFTKRVPHIHEKIFFSLDYDSYKTCLEVSNDWLGLLTSESYLMKAKSIFKNEIVNDEDELCSAAGDGKIGKVTRLLSSGLLDIKYVRRGSSLSPLGMAAKYGHKDVVILLLKRGADINKGKGNAYNGTPLHFAANCGRKGVVRVLLEKGAEVDIKDTFGDTPLSEAADRGHKQVVQLLLNAGADPNTRNSKGETPLDQAFQNYCNYHQKDVVQLLLKVTALPTRYSSHILKIIEGK